MTIVGVYCITNTKTGKRYVGSSIDVHKRVQAHLNGFGSASIRLILSRQGRGDLAWEVMEECLPEDRIKAEARWIEKLRPEYNRHYLTDDGLIVISDETRARMSEAARGRPGGMKGRKHSAEARKKMSKARAGRPGFFSGCKHTEESKEKMRLAVSGRVLSDEHRRKIGEKSRGRKMSDEAKAKIAASRRGVGQPHSEETKAAIRASMAAVWQDPEYRARQKAITDDPEWRARISATKKRAR